MAFAAVRFGIFLEIGHCLAPLVFLLLRARPRLANVGVTASVRLQYGIGETFILLRFSNWPEGCERQLWDCVRTWWRAGGGWTSL